MTTVPEEWRRAFANHPGPLADQDMQRLDSGRCMWGEAVAAMVENHLAYQRVRKTREGRA